MSTGVSRGSISFDHLRYPGSMSAYLYGPNGDPVVKGRNLRVVGSFRFQRRAWSILYSLLPLSDMDDLVFAMNREIREREGDGIVNVAIASQSGIMTDIYLLNLLPIWPTYSTVTIQGEIVRYESSSLPSAPWPGLFGSSSNGALRILATTQEETVLLHEHCAVVGKPEVICFQVSRDDRASVVAGAEITWLAFKEPSYSAIQSSARARGANIAEIMNLDLSYHESTPTFWLRARNAAFEMRYWKCP